MLHDYRELKNKFKIKRVDSMYNLYITDVTSMMFNWDEKIFQPYLFDRMLRDCGWAALIETDTSPYSPVFFSDIDLGNGRYADGMFQDCVCFDFRGNEYKFKKWRDNPDVLVFFNTPLHNPDIFQEHYAEMLTETDVSILNNVHYSRMHPVPIARDKTTLNRIQTVMKSMSEGKFDTVLMETAIKDILDGKEGIEMLNLTDVDKQQYIQYLSHLHDSVISRLFFMLGLGTTDNGKQAQITVPELNKNDDASITMALAWYEARKEGFDEAKKKGHDFKFDFSDIWKSRFEAILQAGENEDGNGQGNVESNPQEDEGKKVDVNEGSGSTDS